MGIYDGYDQGSYEAPLDPVLDTEAERLRREQEQAAAQEQARIDAERQYESSMPAADRGIYTTVQAQAGYAPTPEPVYSDNGDTNWPSAEAPVAPEVSDNGDTNWPTGSGADQSSWYGTTDEWGGAGSVNPGDVTPWYNSPGAAYDLETGSNRNYDLANEGRFESEIDPFRNWTDQQGNGYQWDPNARQHDLPDTLDWENPALAPYKDPNTYAAWQQEQRNAWYTDQVQGDVDKTLWAGIQGQRQDQSAYNRVWQGRADQQAWQQQQNQRGDYTSDDSAFVNQVDEQAWREADPRTNPILAQEQRDYQDPASNRQRFQQNSDQETQRFNGLVQAYETAVFNGGVRDFARQNGLSESEYEAIARAFGDPRGREGSLAVWLRQHSADPLTGGATINPDGSAQGGNYWLAQGLQGAIQSVMSIPGAAAMTIDQAANRVFGKPVDAEGPLTRLLSVISVPQTAAKYAMVSAMFTAEGDPAYASAVANADGANSRQALALVEKYLAEHPGENMALDLLTSLIDIPVIKPGMRAVRRVGGAIDGVGRVDTAGIGATRPHVGESAPASIAPRAEVPRANSPYDPLPAGGRPAVAGPAERPGASVAPVRPGVAGVVGSDPRVAPPRSRYLANDWGDAGQVASGFPQPEQPRPAAARPVAGPNRPVSPYEAPVPPREASVPSTPNVGVSAGILEEPRRVAAPAAGSKNQPPVRSVAEELFPGRDIWGEDPTRASPDFSRPLESGPRAAPDRSNVNFQALVADARRFVNDIQRNPAYNHIPEGQIAAIERNVADYIDAIYKGDKEAARALRNAIPESVFADLNDMLLHHKLDAGEIGVGAPHVASVDQPHYSGTAQQQGAVHTGNRLRTTASDEAALIEAAANARGPKGGNAPNAATARGIAAAERDFRGEPRAQDPNGGYGGNYTPKPDRPLSGIERAGETTSVNAPYESRTVVPERRVSPGANRETRGAGQVRVPKLSEVRRALQVESGKWVPSMPADRAQEILGSLKLLEPHQLAKLVLRTEGEFGATPLLKLDRRGATSPRGPHQLGGMTVEQARRTLSDVEHVSGISPSGMSPGKAKEAVGAKFYEGGDAPSARPKTVAWEPGKTWQEQRGVVHNNIDRFAGQRFEGDYQYQRPKGAELGDETPYHPLEHEPYADRIQRLLGEHSYQASEGVVEEALVAAQKRLDDFSVPGAEALRRAQRAGELGTWQGGAYRGKDNLPKLAEVGGKYISGEIAAIDKQIAALPYGDDRFWALVEQKKGLAKERKQLKESSKADLAEWADREADVNALQGRLDELRGESRPYVDEHGDPVRRSVAEAERDSPTAAHDDLGGLPLQGHAELPKGRDLSVDHPDSPAMADWNKRNAGKPESPEYFGTTMNSTERRAGSALDEPLRNLEPPGKPARSTSFNQMRLEPGDVLAPKQGPKAPAPGSPRYEGWKANEELKTKVLGDPAREGPPAPFRERSTAVQDTPGQAAIRFANEETVYKKPQQWLKENAGNFAVAPAGAAGTAGTQVDEDDPNRGLKLAAIGLGLGGIGVFAARKSYMKRVKALEEFQMPGKMQTPIGKKFWRIDSQRAEIAGIVGEDIRDRLATGGVNYHSATPTDRAAAVKALREYVDTGKFTGMVASLTDRSILRDTQITNVFRKIGAEFNADIPRLLSVDGLGRIPAHEVEALIQRRVTAKVDDLLADHIGRSVRGPIVKASEAVQRAEATLVLKYSPSFAAKNIRDGLVQTAIGKGLGQFGFQKEGKNAARVAAAMDTAHSGAFRPAYIDAEIAGQVGLDRGSAIDRYNPILRATEAREVGAKRTLFDTHYDNYTTTAMAKELGLEDRFMSVTKFLTGPATDQFKGVPKGRLAYLPEAARRELLGAKTVGEVRAILRREGVTGGHAEEAVGIFNSHQRDGRAYAQAETAVQMRNYAERSNLDTALSTIYPFHYWTTRGPVWTAHMAARYPLASAAVAVGAVWALHENKDLPLKDKLGINVPVGWLVDQLPMSPGTKEQVQRGLDWYMNTHNRDNDLHIGLLNWAAEPAMNAIKGLDPTNLRNIVDITDPANMALAAEKLFGWKGRSAAWNIPEAVLRAREKNLPSWLQAALNAGDDYYSPTGKDFKGKYYPGVAGSTGGVIRGAAETHGLGAIPSAVNQTLYGQPLAPGERASINYIMSHEGLSEQAAREQYFGESGKRSAMYAAGVAPVQYDPAADPVAEKPAATPPTTSGQRYEDAPGPYQYDKARDPNSTDPYAQLPQDPQDKAAQAAFVKAHGKPPADGTPESEAYWKLWGEQVGHYTPRDTTAQDQKTQATAVREKYKIGKDKQGNDIFDWQRLEEEQFNRGLPVDGPKNEGLSRESPEDIRAGLAQIRGQTPEADQRAGAQYFRDRVADINSWVEKEYERLRTAGTPKSKEDIRNEPLPWLGGETAYGWQRKYDPSYDPNFYTPTGPKLVNGGKMGAGMLAGINTADNQLINGKDNQGTPTGSAAQYNAIWSTAFDFQDGSKAGQARMDAYLAAPYGNTGKTRRQWADEHKPSDTPSMLRGVPPGQVAASMPSSSSSPSASSPISSKPGVSTPSSGAKPTYAATTPRPIAASIPRPATTAPRAASTPSQAASTSASYPATKAASVNPFQSWLDKEKPALAARVSAPQSAETRAQEPGASAKDTAQAWTKWEELQKGGKATVADAIPLLEAHVAGGGNPAAYVRRAKNAVYATVRAYQGATRQAGDKQRGEWFAAIKALPEDAAGLRKLSALEAQVARAARAATPARTG